MHNGLATRVLEKTKRAISPGRMSSKKNESVVDQYKDWFGDPTPVLRCEYTLKRGVMPTDQE